MFDPDYQDRQGFDPKFLQPGKVDGSVALPRLSPALTQLSVPLIGSPKKNVLPYHHFSLVMHRVRRFAIYSAANVDYQGRFNLDRPADEWRVDPRIDASAQVTEAMYTHNQFDRGHLTRREDLEYGANTDEALTSAADTCHWTNCTPQQARFNESAKLWQGLERHILEQAVDKDHFRAQVITGPVFDAQDPAIPGFPETPIPLRFWKVVAAINASGHLFATAYILDQRELIQVTGLRGAPEVPFTPYKTYQTLITEVENLTGLAFRGGRGRRLVPLSEFDPLAKARVAAGVGRVRGAAPASYVELRSLGDVAL
jgi:endonuclease G, mitochondrial